ncbi:MAG: hypothetical protein KGH67_00525 [Candidatus Micrarchaeota archaeon]|nr:hypothetical protein [Candidatus Micrarchaeota archaeon]MDE1858996.1 hypothetical protein [Candidatus Micrarchaeota archaeon]
MASRAIIIGIVLLILIIIIGIFVLYTLGNTKSHTPQYSGRNQSGYNSSGYNSTGYNRSGYNSSVTIVKKGGPIS